MRSIKEQLKISNSQTDETATTASEFDTNTLETIYRIASELLDSLHTKQEQNEPKHVADANNEESNAIKATSSEANENPVPASATKSSQAEFYSATAERILQESPLNENAKLEQQMDSEKEADEKKAQFKILNGGANDTNYKNALDYLGTVMKFKINYQSLLGVTAN